MLRRSVFVGVLAYAVLPVRAGELAGRVFDQEGRPVAGASLKLLQRGDSTLSDADGRYRLPLRTLGVWRGDASGAAPRLRGGELHFQARAGEPVRLEAFDSRGRRTADRSWRARMDGLQGVTLAGVTDGLRGLGWLRLTLAGGARVLRVVDAGHGPLAAGADLSAARRSAAPDPVDSLRVTMEGFYDARAWLYSLDGEARDFRLWRNSIHALPPAEIEAWKQHLLTETFTLYLSRAMVVSRSAAEEFSLVLADGLVAEAWRPGPCGSGPRPQTVRLAYSHGGTTYRDTIPLARYWAFLDGLQATRDSVRSDWHRYRVTWSLPESLSALPERDRMILRVDQIFYGDSWKSEPDVFQHGVGFGIEGGTHTWGHFEPRAGWDTVHSVRADAVGVGAWLTRARRPGHNLAIELSGQAPILPLPKVAFRNTWPAGNSLRKGLVIGLDIAREGDLDSLLLEWKPGGDTTDSWIGFAGLPQGQSSFDWAFTQPLLTPRTIRLRVREVRSKGCLVQAVSPTLTVTPDPADTLMAAFEPNESSGQAALIPRGVWLSAGWDFRGYPAAEDADYYRFPATAGEKVRFSVANPDSGQVLLGWDCGGPASGIMAEAGGEMSHVITVDRSGDCGVHLRDLDGTASTYRFRIDPVP